MNMTTSPAPSPEFRDIPSVDTTASDPGNLPLDLLSQPLRGQVEWVQRRYGLDLVSACMATLVSVVCACGPSRRILNPIDDSFLPPAMSVVLHGDAMHLGAAVNLSLDPSRRWLLNRIGRPDKRDLRRSRLHLADLHRERSHLKRQLQTDGFAPPAGPFGVRDEKEVTKLREKTRGALEAVLNEIESTTFLLLPHVLADDARVAQLLTPGRLALDGAILAASLSGEAVTAWSTATGPEKAALARLLSLSWCGWPQAGDEETHACPLLSAALVTAPDEARLLWNDKALAGVNRHLFFIGQDANPAFDLGAELDGNAGDFCHSALQSLIEARLEGRRVDHHLNAAATTHFQAFLNQAVTEARLLPSNQARRLERAPVLALKLALLVHMASPAQGEETIDVPTVEFACRLADAVCARDLDFVLQNVAVSPLEPGSPPQLDAPLSTLVARLKRCGPLLWDPLLRGCRIQKAAPLKELVARGIAAGVIRIEGDLYCAVEPGAAP